MTQSAFHSLLQKSSLDKLREAINRPKDNREEEGYWKLTTDKAGNGSAIIRFLPAPPPETVHFASYWRHAFQGPNGWYIELSRTGLGENDPVGDFNSRLWKTGDKSLQDQVRSQSRKLTYVANIYVIQDKANPENEGKVFLFKFGKKIFDKIDKAVNPEFDDQVPFDPFHVLEGANFRIRQKKQAGFPNYDDSAFEMPSPMLGGNETAILNALQGLKSLQEITSPERYKSYDDLKKRLDRVMGFDTAAYMTPNDVPVSTTATAPSEPKKSELPTPPKPQTRPWTPPAVDDDELDERLSKFDDE